SEGKRIFLHHLLLTNGAKKSFYLLIMQDAVIEEEMSSSLDPSRSEMLKPFIPNRRAPFLSTHSIWRVRDRSKTAIFLTRFSPIRDTSCPSSTERLTNGSMESEPR